MRFPNFIYMILGILLFAVLSSSGTSKIHYEGPGFRVYSIWIGVMAILGVILTVWRDDLQKHGWKPRSDSRLQDFIYRAWIVPESVMDFLLYFYCGFSFSAFWDVLFYAMNWSF